jgi:predicted RNase H-like HicB family nuclease
MTEAELRALARRYPVTISADPDEGYVAIIPDWPRVYTNGRTPEEALANAYEAIELAVEGVVERKAVLPQPQRIAA